MLQQMERETYRDCMRNHAATLGTYATDGCGEYTPNNSSPGRLQCAACGCHRNFHRKVPAESPEPNTNNLDLGAPGHSPVSATSDGVKRRVRTKFSAEQKDKMLKFSEKIGWRIPRRDGDVDEVGRFCREIGVNRQVFKVWMHNHKNTGNSSSSTSAAAAAAIVAGGAAGVDDDEEEHGDGHRDATANASV